MKIIKKTQSVSTVQYLINKSIEAVGLEVKELESYTNEELFKISSGFASKKVQKLKEEFGEEVFQNALNKVAFTDSEDDDDFLGI